MKHQEKTPKEVLEEAVVALRAEKPEAETIEAAGERVLQHLNQVQAEMAGGQAGEMIAIGGCQDVRRLLPQYRSGQISAARALLVEAHLHECFQCRHEAESDRRSASALKPWRQELPRVSNDRFGWAMAAAAVIVLAVGTYFLQDQFFSSPRGLRARVESLY
jgi:hypothetical protein